MKKTVFLPQAVTLDELLAASHEACFTDRFGTTVYVSGLPGDTATCPSFAAEIEELTEEATGRVDGILHHYAAFRFRRVEVKPEIAEGIKLVLTSFRIDECWGEGTPSKERKLANGCSYGSYAFVKQSYLQWTWPHELGHFIVEKTGMASDGDPRHELCGFWWRLVGRKCDMDIGRRERE